MRIFTVSVDLHRSTCAANFRADSYWVSITMDFFCTVDLHIVVHQFSCFWVSFLGYFRSSVAWWVLLSLLRCNPFGGRIFGIMYIITFCFLLFTFFIIGSIPWHHRWWCVVIINIIVITIIIIIIINILIFIIIIGLFKLLFHVWLVYYNLRWRIPSMKFSKVRIEVATIIDGDSFFVSFVSFDWPLIDPHFLNSLIFFHLLYRSR